VQAAALGSTEGGTSLVGALGSGISETDGVPLAAGWQAASRRTPTARTGRPLLCIVLMGPRWARASQPGSAVRLERPATFGSNARIDLSPADFGVEA
jgi:hypothetical protein